MLRFRIRLLAIAIAALVAPRTLAAQAMAAGDTLHLRLLDRLATGHRAPGRVRAMVMAPVLDASARVAIPPGSIVTGRVTGAGTERYGGKRHWIAFLADSIAIPMDDATDDSMHASIAMRMLAIDDSRESVDSGGRIVGAPIPSIIRSKRDWAVLVLGVFHPLGALVIAATLEGERIERHRAIALGAGTELTAVITRAATLPQWTRWAPPPPIPRGIVDPDSLAESAPLRARLADIGAPADVISIAVIGSAAKVNAAFAKAGWTLAVPLDLRGDFVTFVRAAKGKGYDAQPVSKLVLDGRAPDRVYEKVT
ncbi:MAG: LssY C-terminal domain-containing protein, partial [Gemmatimonadota bacterium]|nr:LssY C-terminal domain-containing protein [Gemmatimonadota bacterium]